MRALYFRRFRLWLPVLDPGCGPVVFVVTSIFRLRGQQSGGGTFSSRQIGLSHVWGSRQGLPWRQL
jgi:hypothetical protein